MKVITKPMLAFMAFATVLILQSFIIYQQNQSNLSLENKVQDLQAQVNNISTAKVQLLSQVAAIENKLDSKPRQLLSMN